ncbi:Glucose-6-phosphate isomerase [Methanococcus vannielii SB]|uniref:Probable glucose-6-phosphate isomerase n=1 Tax=Methanococcus vannielii (strain ATCC 35089 / DSM 1224 / JCM 13029 / OCM 148 / SB) TaxID=406327 RepID=A6UPT9_METVS|nr:glucose-6-phosphate isomerase [Methanococcus vannielii]ABR54511.1 Glucose-6-phosphate isomerase [Methanococcus vannielii SB]
MNGEFLFNYSNSMNTEIGDFGISISDIDNELEKATSCIQNLRDKEENGELGFLDVLKDNLDNYEELKEYSKNFENLLIIGIGGSNLGLRASESAILGSLTSRYDKPKIHYMDNSDPEKTNYILKKLDLENTLVFVISKSGNTIETLANFFVVRNLMKKKNFNWTKNIVSITHDGELKKLTEKEKYIHFDVPKNVGGRFSVLSSVGLAPMACAQINIKKLTDGAKLMEKSCKLENIFKNPALMNSFIHYMMYNRGKKVSVMMPYIERLRSFGMWYGQLWAESLGKNGFGQTPVTAVGATSQHSQLQLYVDGPKDKIVTFLSVKKFKCDLEIEYEYESAFKGYKMSEIINSELVGTENSLKFHNVPTVKIVLDELNEITLGKLFLMYEMQTAISGEIYGINAFDQPAVEHGKKIAHEFLTKNRSRGMSNELHSKNHVILSK